MMIRAIVDPLMFPWAETYFLEGLMETIKGMGGITLFDSRPFTGIDDGQRGIHTFNFIIEDGQGNDTKYAIDWYDINGINSPGVYSWCDIYGKVNTNWKVTPKEDYPKIVSIGPSMGINIYTLPNSILTFLNICWKSHILFSKKVVKYAHYYYRELHRGRIDSYNYQKDKVDNGYVFFLSTLWYNAGWNDNDIRLNTPRYKLMKYCKSMPEICFEGGFVAHNSRNNANGYVSSTDKFSDCIYGKRMTLPEYITKMRRSMVALNMPAVVSCFGWKLAEYLALGKCIISLPLVNDLPQPLEHGVNIHFIDSIEQVRDALIYIYGHPEYRKKLERGARKYYEEWCSPKSAMRLIGL